MLMMKVFPILYFAIASSTSTKPPSSVSSVVSSISSNQCQNSIGNHDDITCILSDVDGTLLSSSHQLSDRTFNALKSAQQKGYLFFPCTGRSRASMLNAAPRIADLFNGDPGSIPGVYQQGLMVYGQTGELIYEKLLDNEIISRVVQFCEENGVAVVAYAGERIFCKRACVQTDYLKTWSDPAVEVYADGIDKLTDININVHKLILLDDEAMLEKIRPKLVTYLNGVASLTKAVPGMLEVLPPGSSKGEGVQVLLDAIGISSENVIAFGDGENDVEMLSMIKIGVAVSNAKDILKTVASTVTLSNNEDGVAVIVEQLPERISRNQ